MRVVLALMGLAAMLAPRRSAASLGEQPSAVPSPEQIVITSENFNTVVHWQYPPMSETPHFIVEIKPYNSGRYKNVSACVNIAAHFCDLTREIGGVFESHWLRVKAVVGSQQSEYVETNEFILQKHGNIGPPKLNLWRHNDELMVDIYHPEFPSENLLPWIRDVYPKLEYWVTFWDSKNQSKEEFPGDDCTNYTCSLEIPIPAEGSTYCVSAKGSLYNDLMIGAPSEESCIHVPLKQTLSTQSIIILCVVTLALSLMVAVYFGCRKLRKSNTKLPKSLVGMMINLNTESILEPKSAAKYTSVISSTQSVLPVNGEINFLWAEEKEEIVNPENSSEGASSVCLPEALAIPEEVSVQESTERKVPSNDDQNHKVKESYFISDSSQVDISASCSDSETSDAEIKQTSSCLKFSGYDKPHVPLHMLIDVGEEQPVMAYRPTD
ncbi:interferon gamma receptor 1 isoform X2 [Melanerpes formicivorus]|uniref:interferon gamma receptor 1 isoform X2 n=1 Tax=Melanerpes formicivorus TaxID=211600 RepID=UPI00358E90DB